jgi:nucleotide-binding universal stress UspA family protein
MKSILVPIDFSKPSENAARYALHLGKYIKANITLCHAVYIPVEVPMQAFDSWPGYELPVLKEESVKALEEVASKMWNKVIDCSMPTAFAPQITCTAEVGGVTDVITQFAEQQKPTLTIMGMTGAGSLARLLFGSISRSMIDKTRHPLMLVPEEFLFDKIRKIGFATSLVDDDIEVIHALACFARYFDADLLVAHVSDINDSDESHQNRFKNFLTDVTCKIDYDKIYFRQLDGEDVDEGLNWLAKNGLIDLLVMVHRQKGWFESLFFSHTHSKANYLSMPLLIMPAGLHPVF